MAAVSRLVSDQDLLKGLVWHAVDCIVRFILKTFSNQLVLYHVSVV